MNQALGKKAPDAPAQPYPTMPGPRTTERPTAYADRIGEWCIRQKSDRERKDHGLFLTPAPVADFMAGRITSEAQEARVLDPAAGVGILCCAAVQALVSRRPKPGVVELVAYEIDVDLLAPLRAVLDHLADWCRTRYGVTVSVHIEAADFIMANAGALRPRGLFPGRTETDNFGVVIANPPYFKIGKDDPRAAAASEVVHGQPNIYALFMAVGASLLRQHGDFVFITPRSFASGPYFRQFRTVFFDMIRPTGVHVFGSRRHAFRRDAVLQENVIVSGVRQDRWHGNRSAMPLAISSSFGVDDIHKPSVREVSAEKVLDLASVDKVLRLPVCDDDEEALALVDSWPSSLAEQGLNISTGPVVPFRATELIAGEGNVPASHVPLLWMNHVRAMKATWPLDRHKPEYIARTAKALLVPEQQLRAHPALQRQGRTAPVDGRPLYRRRFRRAGNRAGEPSQLRSPARRPTLGGRGLGSGGALQQPPPRHQVPSGQRQHPGKRHRTARHAASRARDDRRTRPADKVPCGPYGRAGCACHQGELPARAKGGGRWLTSEKHGRSSKPWACRRPQHNQMAGMTLIALCGRTSASLPTSRVPSLSSMPRIRALSRVATITVSYMLLIANV